MGSVAFVIVNMYFDIKRSVDECLEKMQAVLVHVSGTGTVFAIESNARSKTWHDVLTNKRCKKLEGFLIGNHLHIANEESCNTTFQTSRVASNIYLTIFNNSANKYLQG